MSSKKCPIIFHKTERKLDNFKQYCVKAVNVLCRLCIQYLHLESHSMFIRKNCQSINQWSIDASINLSNQVINKSRVKLYVKLLQIHSENSNFDKEAIVHRKLIAMHVITNCVIIIVKLNEYRRLYRYQLPLPSYLANKHLHPSLFECFFLI